MICKEIESLSRTQNIKSHFDSANHWYFRLKTIWAIIIHSLNGDLENQSLWKTSIPLKSLFPLINLTYSFLIENRNFKIDITSILPLLSHKNGALYGAQNYKHLSPKFFTFVKFWKSTKKIEIPQFFCFVYSNERGEEGQPQQLLVRATFSSFSRSNHHEIPVLRLLCVEKFQILEDKTIFLIWPR